MAPPIGPPPGAREIPKRSFKTFVSEGTVSSEPVAIGSSRRFVDSVKAAEPKVGASLPPAELVGR